MAYAILFGEYDLTIDEKNRLLIPSEVRKSLQAAEEGDILYLTVGAANKKLWIYPKKNYDTMAGNAPLQMAPSPEVLRFRQWYFAMTTEIQWDKQGRILVPEKTLRRTNTTREITMIGAGDHLEIWNRSDWEARYQENLADSDAIYQKMHEQDAVRLNSQPTGPQ